MPGFLYFLPHAQQADIPDRLGLWGLDYLRDGDRRLHSRGCTGPGGVHGFIVGAAVNWQPEEVKIRPDITWQPFPKPFAERQAQLGYVGQMPGPADLIREKTISGEYLTLADGHRWLVPHAQVVTDGHPMINLPVSYGLDEDSGDWIANQILPQYRAIWQHANKYLNAMWAALDLHFKSGAPDGAVVSWDIEDAESLVVDALQANYRVSARELATLGILTSDLASQIAKILIDDEGYGRLKKKEVPDTGAG